MDGDRGTSCCERHSSASWLTWDFLSFQKTSRSSQGQTKKAVPVHPRRPTFLSCLSTKVSYASITFPSTNQKSRILPNDEITIVNIISIIVSQFKKSEIIRCCWMIHSFQYLCKLRNSATLKASLRSAILWLLASIKRLNRNRLRGLAVSVLSNTNDQPI